MENTFKYIFFLINIVNKNLYECVMYSPQVIMLLSRFLFYGFFF
jgi:hypothetical protein